MKNRTISRRQMLTVVFLSLFPLGTEVLFQRLARVGAAGWLCPLLAGLAAVLLGYLAGRRGICSQERMDRPLAGGLLLWGLFFGSGQSCRIGLRLSDVLGASPVFVTGLLLVLAAWMAAGGLPAFARACEIFLLAVGSGLALILLGGVFRLRWDWVLLWTPQELAKVPMGAMECLGLLAVGCYALILIDNVTPERGSLGQICWGVGRIFALLGAVGILVLGRFGAALTGHMERPFFQMVSGLGLEGAFQRLEQLASALWVLGDLALLGFLLLALVRLMAWTAATEEQRGWTWPLAGILFLLALPIGYWQDVLAGPVLWIGNLAAGGLILACFAAKKKK